MTFLKVFYEGENDFTQDEKRRAPSFPKAPFIVSMAISRILSQLFASKALGMIIHLTRTSPNARRIFIRRSATIPEDFIGPAALPLFCLAPHGVFRASQITPRAVSSYLAFSPLPAFRREAVSFPYSCSCQRTGGMFSVTLSVNIRFSECCPRILRGTLPYGVRTFLQRAARGSPAIICHRRVNYHKSRNLEATKP
jgi:hypothetical protein